MAYGLSFLQERLSSGQGEVGKADGSWGKWGATKGKSAGFST